MKQSKSSRVQVDAFLRSATGALPCAVLCISMLGGCANLRNAFTSTTSQREFVIDGKWVRSTTKGNYLGYHRVHRMSPLVLDNMIIQGNSIDGIVAYGREDGNELWRVNLRNGVEGGAQAVDGKLYFGSSDGNFYCLNLTDGTTVWSVPLHAETLAAPTVDGGIVYVENGADVVFALDATTGKQIWMYNRQTTTNFSIRASTRPTVTADFVYVGFTDGYVVALKRRDGTVNWEKKIGKAARFRDVDSTPVLEDGNLYVASFDGTLYSLKADTGNINWQLEEGAYVPVTLGTGPFADRLYYSTVNGKILFIDKHSGKVLQTISLRKGIATQPVFFKSTLVYGESEGALVVADAESGSTISRFEPGWGLLAKPSVIEATGDAYIMSSGANLYTFKLGYQRRTDRLPWQETAIQ